MSFSLNLKWHDIGYRILATEDGSPSLISLNAERAVEPMHHSAGALSESKAIYGEFISEIILKLNMKDVSPKFLSIGLGLGYNEMLLAEKIIKQNKFSQTWTCISFEKDTQLIDSFRSWLSMEVEESEKLKLKQFEKISDQTTILQTYEFIASLLPTDKKTLKKELKNAMESQRLVFLPQIDVSSKNIFTNQYPDLLKNIHGFIWDAFSSKVSPELWDTELIANLLQEWGDAEICGFASYAHNRKIKDALSSAQFILEKQKGFGGKRESTRAWRQ